MQMFDVITQLIPVRSTAEARKSPIDSIINIAWIRGSQRGARLEKVVDRQQGLRGR